MKATERISPDADRRLPFSDGEVVARIVGGDTGAFELLMRRYNQRLFRTARSVLPTDADAEDALQEAYLRAYRSLEGFEGRSALSTWLTRIAFHEALRLRRRLSRAAKMERSDRDLLTASVPDQTAGSSMFREDHHRLIDTAFSVLADGDRGVVMLRLIQGLSTRETAESLRMTESNVKVRLHRAKHKLAGALEGAALEQLREELSFDGERCDRMVTRVFARIEASKR